jgi:hypothetical protein
MRCLAVYSRRKESPPEGNRNSVPKGLAGHTPPVGGQWVRDADHSSWPQFGA